MTKLIFIRHGESELNLEGRYTGQLNATLTKRGALQAKITTEHLLCRYSIDAVYSSDLSRAIETARPIAEALGLKIHTDERLREIYAGEWQGLLFSEVRQKYKEDYEFYRADRAKRKTTGGEGMADVCQRALAAVLDIAKENEGKTVIVSTHNGPLSALQAPFLNIPLNDVKSLTNNSITEVDWDGETFKVILLGYDAHLGALSTGFTEKTAN